MTNFKINDPWTLHLSAQENFSARSGRSRTEEYGEGVSEQKIELGAKKLTGSGAPRQSRSATAVVKDKEIEVNAYYFANGKTFKSYPKAITVDHKRYTFLEGLQMLVQKGQGVVRFFDMTDGFNNFRLREENDQWFLVSRRPVLR